MSIPAPASGQALLLGLRLYEWLTLIGIVIGPICAVAITLFVEGARRRYESRIQLLRAILATRHLPSDPAYSTTVNLIPVAFNSSGKVMDAWRVYTDHVNALTIPEKQEEYLKRINVRQAELITAMMHALGLKYTQSQIQVGAYVSRGYVERDGVLLASQRAMPEIAKALKRQNVLTEAILRAGGHIPPD